MEYAWRLFKTYFEKRSIVDSEQFFERLSFVVKYRIIIKKKSEKKI
jgi:hypothetical protein